MNKKTVQVIGKLADLDIDFKSVTMIDENLMEIKFDNLNDKTAKLLNENFKNADCYRTYKVCVLDLREQ